MKTETKANGNGKDANGKDAPNGKGKDAANGNAIDASNGREWEHIQHPPTKELFQILTGNVFFPSRPFRSDEYEPDLIIRWRLPDPQKDKLKLRNEFASINSLVSVPQPQLERAFELAQKKIMYEMNKNKENQDSTVVKFRYMQSLLQAETPKKNMSKVELVNGGEEELEFICFDEKKNTLDGFTLYMNAFISILQRQCGLKVRSFLVHSLVDDEDNKLLNVIDEVGDQIGLDLGPKKPVRDIYLFLNMSIDNMLKVASRVEMKKAIDYSNLDFGLNDPTTEDDRPIKYHTKYRQDKERRDQFKNLTRYFKVREQNDINTDVLGQTELSLLEEQRFRSYWEESYAVFEFLKSRIGEDISNQEKVFLYEYNRGKINPGCEKVLSSMKKRREYFQLQKYICEKYQYKVHQDPELYQEFQLSNKNAKGGFFQKLRNILVYKPNFVTPYGDIALFNSMERTKLCYLMIKSTFKVNFLSQELNMDLITPNNLFEKNGEGGKDQKVRGGLDGTFLKDRWYIYGLFSDIRTIRGYYGDVIAHEMMIKIWVITYLFFISVPYGVLFILELLYSGTFQVASAMIKASFFAISFSMFTLFIEETEQFFVKSYSDNRHSKVFSNSYKGPYIRNVLTDELNEFEEEEGFVVFLRNFLCLLIFGVLVVLFGAIFHGCRMFLVEIYNDLFALKQGDYFSFPHLLAYSIYLVISQIFQNKMYDKIVKGMIWIKNPSSDIIERNLKNYFTFYYLLTIQLIPITFFFLVEPFAGTSCYSVSCSIQFFHYIYARFLFNIFIAVINFIRAVLILFRHAKKKLEEDLAGEVEEVMTFQVRLKKMINTAIEQANKPQYEDALNQDILSLFAYCFYCVQLPISGIIAFGIVVATYIITRIELLYEKRRPINKSEPIIRFSNYCKVIYIVGSMINIWINTFLFSYVERHYHFIIFVAPQPLTGQTIFMIKIALTTFFVLIITLLGVIARNIAILLSPKGLMHRQHFKYQQYQKLVGGLKNRITKVESSIPLKSVFGTFNPDLMPHQKLNAMLDTIDKVQQEKNDVKMIEGLLAKKMQDDKVSGINIQTLAQSIVGMQKKESKNASMVRRSGAAQMGKQQSKEDLNDSSSRLKNDRKM